MSTAAKQKQEYTEKWLQNYELFKSRANGDAGWMDAQRSQAILQFGELGFPSTKHEEWKYTSVLPLLKEDFGFSGKHEADFVRQMGIEGLQAHRLVLMNGVFVPELSTILAENQGNFVGSIRECYEQIPSVVDAHLGRLASAESETFANLNTAFMLDGAMVVVPDGHALKYPVQIIHYAGESGRNVYANARALMIFGDRAEGTVLERFVSAKNSTTWTNRISEIFVGDGANASVITLQNDHENAHLINQTFVKEGKQSNFSSNVLSLDGGIVRNNLSISMEGEHSEAHMHGLYLLNGKTHVDNHTLVDHTVPNCFSNELYKGVMDDQSTGVFNGKVIVRPHAQKTNAFQSNKNILMSDKATINTKPQLEIFADDVKCSHGATTGRLDEEALFYIRSRGLGEKDARALLTLAFASETAASIKNEAIRSYFESLIADRLYSHA